MEENELLEYVAPAATVLMLETEENILQGSGSESSPFFGEVG